MYHAHQSIVRPIQLGLGALWGTDFSHSVPLPCLAGWRASPSTSIKTCGAMGCPPGKYLLIVDIKSWNLSLGKSGFSRPRKYSFKTPATELISRSFWSSTRGSSPVWRQWIRLVRKENLFPTLEVTWPTWIGGEKDGASLRTCDPQSLHALNLLLENVQIPRKEISIQSCMSITFYSSLSWVFSLLYTSWLKD